MLRRIFLVGLLAAAVVPVTSSPASAICTIFVETSQLGEGIGNVGPYNCNYCPAVEQRVEKLTGDILNCWT